MFRLLILFSREFRLDLAAVAAHDSNQPRHPGEAARNGAGNTEAGLTTATKMRFVTMADPNATTIPLELRPNEAAAFSQFVKRVDYDTVGGFTVRTITYGGRTEHDVAWCAVNMLRRQLAEAGFAPR